jgi:hypothetical protein
MAVFMPEVYAGQPRAHHRFSGADVESSKASASSRLDFWVTMFESGQNPR